MNIKILRINQKYLIYFIAFLVFFIPRIIGLGGDLANYDSTLWYPRLDRFVIAISSGQYLDTYQKYHPGVLMMWVSGFASYFFQIIFEFVFGYNPRFVQPQFPRLNFATIFPLVFLISLLGTYCFYVIRKNFSNKIAFIFIILLSIEPFFLGVTRFLHLTGINSMLMYASFLAIADYLIHAAKNTKLLAFSSILIGFAFLTKIDSIGAYIFNLALLYFVLAFRSKKIITLSILKKCLVYAFIPLIVFYMVFPAMWVDPVAVLQRIYNEGIVKNALDVSGDLEDFSENFNYKYLFYPYMFMLRSTPIFLFSMFVGVFVFIKNWNKSLATDSRSQLFLSWIILYFLFNFLFLSIPGKMIDRYMITFFPPLAVICAIGFKSIFDLVGIKKSIFVLSVYYFSVLFSYYPNFSFYYSEIFGGPANVSRLGIQLKNRGEYYAQAAYYLNSINDNKSSKFTLVYHAERKETFGYFYLGTPVITTKQLPEDRFLNYLVVEQPMLNQIATDKCQQIKSVGPRYPFEYSYLYIFECKNIDRDSKDFKLLENR